MRVRFFSPTDDSETECYLDTVARIDRFWKIFTEISSASVEHWLGDLRAHLARVAPGLGVELRTTDDAERILYLVPIAGPELLPLARWVVERAPARFPWTFETARPALDLPAALLAVQQDFNVDLSQARARVGISRGHLVDVVVASHEFSHLNRERALDAAEQLVACLAGDPLFDAWVGSVDALVVPRPSLLPVVGAGAAIELPIALTELAATLEVARAGIFSGLGSEPCHAFCERAEWTLFEIEPNEPLSDGQPSTALDLDLLLAGTSYPEMLKCYLSGLPFSSARFSRHQERFCHLQLALNCDRSEQIELRTRLETTIDRALVPGRLGCVVGSGVGKEHAHIFLALTNLEPAIALIQRRLQQAEVPRKSWLAFCDDEWRNEWVGIWPDTPAPAGTIRS